MQEALFLDVSKSQASRFYEEVGSDGAPVLRPAAGAGDDSAQLVGLADHVIMRVCITSKLPLPIKVCPLPALIFCVQFPPCMDLCVYAMYACAYAAREV